MCVCSGLQEALAFYSFTQRERERYCNFDRERGREREKLIIRLTVRKHHAVLERKTER